MVIYNNNGDKSTIEIILYQRCIIKMDKKKLMTMNSQHHHSLNIMLKWSPYITFRLALFFDPFYWPLL